jgi:hypothetical protein
VTGREKVSPEYDRRYRAARDRLFRVLDDLDLTESELRTFEWLLGWENHTIENIATALEKARRLP